MEITPSPELLPAPQIKIGRLGRILHREYLWLCVIVAVTLALHFTLIYQEYHPFFLFQQVTSHNYFLKHTDTIFDEKYYVSDAGSILTGNGTQRPEHLPLGKLIIVAGMKIFGDNPLGWRFFPILMGAAGIVFFYLVCRRLNMSKTAAYLATFFLAFENQTFIITGIAMLDVSLLPLMLISFWLYLRKNYLLAGIFIGLSGLVKLTGFMVLPVIVLHWIAMRREGDWKFLALIVLAPVSFLVLLPGFDYFIFGGLVNPFERVYTVLSMSSSLTFANAYQTIDSRPWGWILNVDMLPLYYRPHYVATISLTVWLVIIPIIGYMVYRAFKGNEAANFALWWFFGTYVLWIPLSLITDRVSFVYYFFPAIGSICVGMGLAFSQLADAWRNSVSRAWRWSAIIGLSGYMVMHLVVFLALSPLTSWWIYPI